MDTKVYADQINHSLGNIKAGSLRLWGQWFGKPYDNEHCIVAARADKNALIIKFNLLETLSVWEPKNITIQSAKFQIDDAARVRWEWYNYGHPAIRENLRFLDLEKRNGQIHASTGDKPWPAPLSPNAVMPAVEIL